MDRYAVVTDGIVTNIISWDGVSEWSPPEGSEAVLIPEGVFVDLGYTWNGSDFSPPVP
jgi:hypothetical protein